MECSQIWKQREVRNTYATKPLCLTKVTKKAFVLLSLKQLYLYIEVRNTPNGIHNHRFHQDLQHNYRGNRGLDGNGWINLYNNKSIKSVIVAYPLSEVHKIYGRKLKGSSHCHTSLNTEQNLFFFFNKHNAI